MIDLENISNNQSIGYWNEEEKLLVTSIDAEFHKWSFVNRIGAIEKEIYTHRSKITSLMRLFIDWNFRLIKNIFLRWIVNAIECPDFDCISFSFISFRQSPSKVLILTVKSNDIKPSRDISRLEGEIITTTSWSFQNHGSFVILNIESRYKAFHQSHH